MTLLSDVISCLAFYTRLPLAGFAQGERSLAEAQWAAPVAGLVLGLFSAAIFLLAGFAGLPQGVAAALALAATTLATGGLHEDGAADTADGLGGGRDREHRLAIMRDSRIGTYGVLALGFSILVRWSALASFADAAGAACALVAAHAVSRAIIPACMHFVPAARADGLSAAAGRPGAPTAAVALAIGAMALPAIGIGIALPAAILLAAWWFWMRRITTRAIGGQTGDTLGALQQGAEAIVLVVALMGHS
jgi:adenosylcobinamide-GDP ribazoletransferase